MKPGIIAASLFASLAGHPAFAFDDEDLSLVYGDKETVSLATGSKQTVRRAPAVATVITAADIAALGATDLDEVLETVPGLHVNRAASMGQSLYVMRGVVGTNAPQVLMLQNGIPVTVALTGNKGNLWGGLPLDNIARIEVLRGPGSALYGADAFAGVINIITKSADEIAGTQAGLRAGSRSTADAWLLHGGKLGALEVAGYLRIGSTDGQARTIDADAQTRNDRAFGTHASLAPGAVQAGVSSLDGSLDLAAGQWRWRSGYKLRDDLETYAGIAQALDPVGRGRSERFTSDLSWSEPELAEDWQASADLAFMHYKQTFPVAAQLLPPGATLPTGTFADGMRGGPEFAERQLRFSASATYRGFAGHQLRLGAGYDDLDLYQTREYRNFNYTATGLPVPAGELTLSPTPFILPQRRQVAYAYAQDEWRLARDWTLTAGLRHDHYSDFGQTTNPRLALVWDTSVDLTTKLLYGTAFRAPAFSEQYAANNPIGQGNPGIKPERNQTLELAFAWQAMREVQLNLNFFRYAMTDIIRTVSNAPAAGTRYDNTGSQHGNGFEFEGNWEATRNLRITGHYSAQRSIDERTGQDAGYAPRRHAYLRGDWIPAGNWLLSAQANHVADRRRAAGDTRPAVPDYTTVDLTLRTTLKPAQRWNFAASVRNLFNADVREPSAYPPANIAYDLPGAPRTFWLQASYGL